MLRGFRSGLAESFKSVEHLGIGYRWVAAKGVRTCLSCIYRDGKITPEPPTQQHVNCRCIFHLVPRDSAIVYESGEEWFARQGPEVQQRMFPSSESYRAYQQGDVTLKDFSGYRQSRTWGGSFQQRSGSEAMRRAR